MRIGIDARTLLTENYTGIARSVYEIICNWVRLYPEHQFYLFSSKRLTLKLKLPANWQIIDKPEHVNNGKLWFFLELPRLIKKYKIDSFWGPSFVLPRKNANTRYYVTVYDLALFKFKSIGEFKNTIRVKMLTKDSCRRADGIVAISKSTAADIEEIFGIEKNKIHVSYIGGFQSDDKKLDASICDVRDFLKFTDPYFLFISTIEPRKNVLNIIRAFEQFRTCSDTSWKLVLAGKKGWKCDEIYKAAKCSEYRNDILMPGFISDAERCYLLERATAFVYPSLYEGFGIPILEAFYYDLPVITAKVSSMPEVAGDAAFYIDDPMDFTGLAELMKHVTVMDGTERSLLSERMKLVLSKFSWEKNAIEVMSILTDGMKE